MYEYDQLSIYRGRDIPITKTITVTQPSIGQIELFGEQKYFNAIHTLTSVGADLKWQLYDLGIDYTEIDDYELFLKLTSQLLKSRKNEITDNISEETKQDLLRNPLGLILNIDLSDYVPCRDTINNKIILYNQTTDSTIDKAVYLRIVDIVRKTHGLKRNNEIPGNDAVKMILIEDAREDYENSKNIPYKSSLLPLVSSLTCSGFTNVWDMKINAFFDSLKRLNKIKESTLLLQGAYSGFASLKDIKDKSLLNWSGSLDD